MTKTIFVFLAVLAAAIATGCGREPAEQAAVAAPVAGTPEAREPADQCGRGKGFSELPAGVCLPASYRVLGQRDYADSAGRGRHRVTFTFAEGDAQSVLSRITDEYSRAGYYVRPKMATKNGSLQVPMTNKNMGTTYLSVTERPQATVQSANWKGSFFIDFMLPPTGPDSTQ